MELGAQDGVGEGGRGIGEWGKFGDDGGVMNFGVMMGGGDGLWGDGWGVMMMMGGG